jgi:hypothetical protein
MQEAIRVLSMRVPRVVGATPLAPMALLNSQGGGGLPAGLLEQLLRKLGMPGGAGGQAQGLPQMAAPPNMGQMAQAGLPAPPGPSFGGAGGPMAAPSLPGLQPVLSPGTTPHITAGARADEPPLGAGLTPPPPPQPQIPNPSQTRQGGNAPGGLRSAQDFYDLARRMRLEA